MFPKFEFFLDSCIVERAVLLFFNDFLAAGLRWEALSGLRSFETEFYENLVKSVMKVF